MKSSDKTQAYIDSAEHIARIVNACYTRGADDKLYPIFIVPYRNEQAIADYQARRAINLSHLSTAQKEALR